MKNEYCACVNGYKCTECNSLEIWNKLSGLQVATAFVYQRAIKETNLKLIGELLAEGYGDIDIPASVMEKEDLF